MEGLAKQIQLLWEHRENLAEVAEPSEARLAVHEAIGALDRGEVHVADVIDDRVVVNEWAKQAILLLFRLEQMQVIEAGPFQYRDKIPLKRDYELAGVRVVPGASARWGSYLAPGVILMPSYVNIGASVGADTLVDTWATVGSCAQIGERVHLSGGVGIGGVLEPPQAAPVVIEDDAFIGSRSMVVEGARVRRGAKLGAGVILTASTPVIDSETGIEVSRGDVPERSIAVSGTRPKQFAGGEFGMPCVLILRYLEPGEEHDKLKLNTIFREHGVAS